MPATECPAARKKIEVMTLHTSVNYGAVFQVYATKKVFEDLGFTVEFTDYIRKNNTDEALARKMIDKEPYRKISRITGGLSDKILYPFARRKVKRRSGAIRSFINTHIPLTPQVYYTSEELKSNPPMADIYCTGSDQVWNSIWNEGIELPYFLDFAPKGKKRIAFAASIGRESIDEEEKKQILPLLKEYRAISVREKSAQDILAEMGIESELVLDPTLMLKKEDWLRLAAPVTREKGEYLLLYILNWSQEVDTLAREIASYHNWKILRICKTPLPLKDMEPVVVNQVEELITYFNEAACILTDSFHATAFSLNLQKHFMVVSPPRFSTRIDNILELTNTKQCWNNTMKYEGTIPEIDWDHVEETLEKERRKTHDFLRRAVED